MIMNEKEGTKFPRSGGTGENTPFTEQSKEIRAGQGSQHNVFSIPMFGIQAPTVKVICLILAFSNPEFG